MLFGSVCGVKRCRPFRAHTRNLCSLRWTGTSNIYFVFRMLISRLKVRVKAAASGCPLHLKSSLSCGPSWCTFFVHRLSALVSVPCVHRLHQRTNGAIWKRSLCLKSVLSPRLCQICRFAMTLVGVTQCFFWVVWLKLHLSHRSRMNQPLVFCHPGSLSCIEKGLLA